MDYDLLQRALKSVNSLGWELTIPSHREAILKAADTHLQEQLLIQHKLNKENTNGKS